MKLHATTIPAQVTALSAWYCLSSQQACVTTQHSRNAGGYKPNVQNLTKPIFAGIAVCKCLAHGVICLLPYLQLLEARQVCAAPNLTQTEQSQLASYFITALDCAEQ